MAIGKKILKIVYYIYYVKKVEILKMDNYLCFNVKLC